MKTYWRIRQSCKFEERFGQLRRVSRLLVIVLIRKGSRLAHSALVVFDPDSRSDKRTRIHEVGSEKAWLDDGDVNAEWLLFGIQRLGDPFNGKLR